MPNETRPSPGRQPGRASEPAREGQPAPQGRPDEELVLVQFKGHRKGYYHNRRGVPVRRGQYCLVEADRGCDLGRINYVGSGLPEWWRQARDQGVLQLAEATDLERLHNNRGDEWEFWDICQEKIQARKLDMNLVSVERQFDHKKITFYFTADQRVDFRGLVRDLAAIFRTRIELRQIGVRDEARLKGGLGICGREYCCSGFLHDFVPVTLKMAKVQQLPLNPGKLSGPCGRLRCCLQFENEGYKEAKRRLPRVGTTVTTPGGPGTVRKIDLLGEKLWVSLSGSESVSEWSGEQVSWSTSEDLPAPADNGCASGNCGNHRRKGH